MEASQYFRRVPLGSGSSIAFGQLCVFGLSFSSWLPGAAKTGTPAPFTIPRNSSYSFFIFFCLFGFLPEIVSPDQSANAGFSPWIAWTIAVSVAGCGSPDFAGRLSPATTNVKLFASAGGASVPVPGRGARAGNVWARATAGSRARKQRRNRERIIRGMAFLQESGEYFTPPPATLTSPAKPSHGG